jgi:hypothetical protein
MPKNFADEMGIISRRLPHRNFRILPFATVSRSGSLSPLWVISADFTSDFSESVYPLVTVGIVVAARNCDPGQNLTK